MKTKKIYNPTTKEYEEVDINTPTKLVDGKRYLLSVKEKNKKEEKETIYRENEYISLRKKLIQDRIDYLSSTDYTIIRELETSKSCPIEIKNKRNQAREEIHKIEEIYNLEELQQYKTNLG